MKKLIIDLVCKECQEKCATFKEKEQKKGHYSNLLPVSFSLRMSIPLDILYNSIIIIDEIV
ncbi:MAG: hypothetical protein QXW92_04740 [Candidatus Hadarchaeales archaeon]